MLHLMFSSVSHELRTPINAFKNSILLIESSHQRFLSKFKEQKFSHISEELYSAHSEQTDERFFTVCKISSTCMMTLPKTFSISLKSRLELLSWTNSHSIFKFSSMRLSSFLNSSECKRASDSK